MKKPKIIGRLALIELPNGATAAIDPNEVTAIMPMPGQLGAVAIMCRGLPPMAVNGTVEGVSLQLAAVLEPALMPD